MDAQCFDASSDTGENDPGKDIFALLFLSFFLINAVVLICITKTSTPTLNLNAGGNGKQVDASAIARIEFRDEKLYIVQNGVSYSLPEDFEKFEETARFEIRKDRDGNETRTILIEDPGRSISAGQMLSAVKVLNDNRIGVEFGKVGAPGEN